MKDKCYLGRYSAAGALGTLGAKEDAVPELTRLLEDADDRVRGVAAIALVELGAKDVVPAKIIEDIKPILKWGADYPQRAAAALRKLRRSVEEKK